MESLARYQRKSTLFRYKHRQRSTDNKLVHEMLCAAFLQNKWTTPPLVAPIHTSAYVLHT